MKQQYSAQLKKLTHLMQINNGICQTANDVSCWNFAERPFLEKKCTELTQFAQLHNKIYFLKNIHQVLKLLTGIFKVYACARSVEICPNQTSIPCGNHFTKRKLPQLMSAVTPHAHPRKVFMQYHFTGNTKKICLSREPVPARTVVLRQGHHQQQY